jgi:hypothetical protein
MKFRWPFMLRSTHEADRYGLLARQNARLGEKDREIARLKAEASWRQSFAPAVAPFWLGLPNEFLTMTVHAGAPAIQASLGGLGHDETSDDPRINLSLPFALKPLR